MHFSGSIEKITASSLSFPFSISATYLLNVLTIGSVKPHPSLKNSTVKRNGGFSVPFLAFASTLLVLSCLKTICFR